CFQVRIVSLAVAIGVAAGTGSGRPAGESSPKASESVVRHVNAEEAHKLVSEKKAVVLDIRMPGEFKEMHIAGATNINFRAADFEQRIRGLARTNAYLVHCAVGGRSTQSLKIFQKRRFETIYHLDGGINGWKEAGLPVEK